MVVISILGPAIVSRPSRGTVGVSVNPPLPEVAHSGYAPSVLAGWQGAEQTAFGEVLRGFQNEHDITVNYQSGGDQVPLVLGNAVAAGHPPDVALLPQPGLLAELVARDEIKPLSEALGSTVRSSYAPFWRNLATVDGKLYGVYFKAANKSTIWYSVPMFRAAHIQSPPKTFSELLADARLLKEHGIAPFSLCGASAWTLTDWFENVYVQTAGPDAYQKLARHAIPWTDPSVTSALSVLRELLGDPANLAGGLEGAKATAYPDCVGRVFGGTQRVAMVYEANFVEGEIQALGLSLRAGSDYDYFPFPSVNGSSPPVVVGGDVAVMLRDTSQARELMEYLATAGAGEAWARRGGFISPNQRVDANTYPNAVTRAAARQLVDPKTVLVFDMSDQMPAQFGSSVGTGEWAGLQHWLADPADVEEVQAQLERDATAAYGPPR